LKPDKEKLLAYAEALMAVPPPVCASDAAMKICAGAMVKVVEIKNYIIKSAKEL